MQQTSDKAAARKRAGLGKNAPKRIEALLHATGGLQDRPRSGCPPVYTADVLDAATEWLVKDECTAHTAATFTAILKEQGVLHASAKPARFMERWAAHLKTTGFHLVPCCTTTKFLIPASDKPQRLAFAMRMLQLLKRGSLKGCMWADETTIEQDPHPKSGMQPPNARFCA